MFNYRKLLTPLNVWVIIFLALYTYTNRETIFPPSPYKDVFKDPPLTRTREIKQNWEYSVKTYYSKYKSKDENTSVDIPYASLSKMGDEGWELVSTYLEMETVFHNFGNSEYHTGMKSNVRPSKVIAIFKRPKRY